MKTAFWISVAVATVLGMSSASAQTFNYTADGGVVEGSVVDHGLSGPVYDPTVAYKFRGTLKYRDDFSYMIGSENWFFSAPPAATPTEHSGLSWGVGQEVNPGPFYLDTRPVPLVDDGDPTTPYLGDGTGDWGQSGAGFRPIVAADNMTVVANEDDEVFGYLVHFNREIRALGETTPRGMDMNISWNLHLDDGAGWTLDKPLQFQLHFWETSNYAAYPEGLAPGDRETCPRSIPGDHTVNGVVFNADGAEDIPREAGVGCDDAWTFAPVGTEAPTFDYKGTTYTIHVSGFYKYEEHEGEYICNGNGIPFDTLWADEQTETVACVKFGLTYEVGDQGCTPGYWKQPQHLDDWVGYAPTDSYNAIFGVAANAYCGDVDEKNAKRKLGDAIEMCPTDMSLGEAIWMTGNSDGLGQVIYQSAAALLNSANPNINYPLSGGAIIDMVQGAFNGTLNPNEVASELDRNNNLHNNDVCGYDEARMEEPL